jgi:hypothetical protein
MSAFDVTRVASLGRCVDLAFDVGTILAGGVDENEIGLKPTRGVGASLSCSSRMRYFPARSSARRMRRVTLGS